MGDSIGGGPAAYHRPSRLGRCAAGSDPATQASTTWLGCSVPSLRQNGPVIIEEPEVVAALRRARARFALVHGSRAASGGGRAESDLDVAAWWGIDPPQPWDVELPTGVDLVVLDQAPLWLAGRIAVDGRLLYDDDPPARVRWQADTRRIWLDEKPYLLQRQREWREAVVARGR